MAEAAHAQFNVVIPEDGYLNGIRGRVWSDERFPTRLGQEDVVLVLARHDSTGLIPWCEADTLARSWALSEVRCNRRRFTEGLPDQSVDAIVEVKKHWSKGKRDYLILCPVLGDGKVCEGVRYDSELGLMIA